MFDSVLITPLENSKTKQRPKMFLQRSILSILSFKQFANLRRGIEMQEKKMRSKRMQIKPILNVNVSKIRKSILPNVTFILNVLSENDIMLVWMDLFFKI